MRHKESKLQILCVKWFRLQYPHVLIYSIPNGGKRTIAEARILVAEGATAGVADLCILRANHLYHGLFIEMKYGQGKQTEKQELFEKYCIRNKYKYEVCRTFEEFKTIVENYL